MCYQYGNIHYYSRIKELEPKIDTKMASGAHAVQLLKV